MPPNIILIILAFYFLNKNSDNRYYDKNECMNISHENNFNLVIMLILIIIYYSKYTPISNLTYINANENPAQELNEDLNTENAPLNDDSGDAIVLDDPLDDPTSDPPNNPSCDPKGDPPKEPSKTSPNDPPKADDEGQTISDGKITQTLNGGINKESSSKKDEAKKAASTKSTPSTVKQSKNTLNMPSQGKNNNNKNSHQVVSKHISQQEEFTYANKEVKSNIQSSSLSNYINNDYQGATVTALLSNRTTVTGEVIFTFEDIVSLKTKENIIFINSKDIVSFC